MKSDSDVRSHTISPTEREKLSQCCTSSGRAMLQFEANVDVAVQTIDLLIVFHESTRAMQRE